MNIIFKLYIAESAGILWTLTSRLIIIPDFVVLIPNALPSPFVC